MPGSAQGDPRRPERAQSSGSRGRREEDPIAVHATSSGPRIAIETSNTDMAAIFYTSGSTGKPKGVVLSHRNMVTGAQSVAQYLGNTPEDRLLAVLPFSFDYGFSQLSTAFHVGARVVLMDYLFPRDVVRCWRGTHHRPGRRAAVVGAARRHAVAPHTEHLRYITNSGGAMPGATLREAARCVAEDPPFLMYGLTEAFRSTFLPPAKSIAAPIRWARRSRTRRFSWCGDGTPCAAERAGRARPSRLAGVARLLERSGEDGGTLQAGSGPATRRRADRNGRVVGRHRAHRRRRISVLHRPSRRDDQDFGLSREPDGDRGNRVRYGAGRRRRAVGVPHSDTRSGHRHRRGAGAKQASGQDAMLNVCRHQLPMFMVPHHVDWRESLPRNPNGKYDRARLAAKLKDLFAQEAMSLDGLPQHAVSVLRVRRGLLAHRRAARSSTIAAQAGRTPFYVYSREDIEAARPELLRATLPREVHLHYAIKANPMPAVVRHLASLVDGLDVASAREMHVALDAGVPTAPHQLRRSGQDASRARRRGRRRDRPQRGVASWRSSGYCASHATRAPAAGRGARQSGLRAEDLRHENGRPARSSLASTPNAYRGCSGLSDAPLAFLGFHIFSGSQNLRADAIVEAQRKAVALAIELARMHRRRCGSSISAAVSAFPIFPARSRSTSGRSPRAAALVAVARTASRRRSS